MQNKSIEIRDLRNQNWVWTSKVLLFHKDIDGNSYKVYSGLASYADNNTQKAFPSIETLSDELHLSRNTVMKSLNKLRINGFLEIEKKIGEHNIYTLLNIGGSHYIQKKVKKEIKVDKWNTQEVFDRFWKIYPNHSNKKVSQQKFSKLSKKIILVMAKDVQNRKINHDTWIKGFIPHLSTYINQERWNDPIIRPKINNKNQVIINPELRKKIFKQNNQRMFEKSSESDSKVKSVRELIKNSY